MNQHQLNEIADRIEVLLAMRDAPIQITGGHLSYNRFDLDAKLLPDTAIEQISRCAAEIASALNVPAVNIVRNGGAIKIEIPRSDPQPLPLLKFMTRIPADRVPACTATLGLCDDDAPILVKFPSQSVRHVLVNGQHGSSLLRTIAASLAISNPARNVQLLTLGRFDALRGLPHLLPQSKPGQAFHSLRAILARRDDQKSTDPRIVVLIAELAELLTENASENLALLRELLLTGSDYGLHIVAATAKPDLKLLQAVTDQSLYGVILTERSDRDWTALPYSLTFTPATVSDADLLDLTQRLANGDRAADILHGAQAAHVIDAKPRERKMTASMKGTTLNLDWDNALGGIKGL